MLNPAFFYSTAIWGQSDVYAGDLILASIVAFISRQSFLGGALYAAAVLTKPQPILAFPALVGIAFRAGKPWYTLGGVACVLLAVLPATYAHGGLIGGYVWLFALFSRASAEYAYATVGAGTLAGILTGDGLNPDSVLGPLGMKIHDFSFACVAITGLAVTVGSIVERARLRSPLALWYLAVSCMLIYWVAPHMHERYIAFAAMFTLVWALAAQRPSATFAAFALSSALFLQMVSNWPLDLGWGADIVTTLNRLIGHGVYFATYCVLNVAGLVLLLASRRTGSTSHALGSAPLVA